MALLHSYGMGGGRRPRAKREPLRGVDALLLAAVERGDHEAVAFLIHEEDVDVNVCDVNGHNANHSMLVCAFEKEMGMENSQHRFRQSQLKRGTTDCWTFSSSRVVTLTRKK